MASLHHYHQKRRFSHTPEPKGERLKKKDSTHHFVVQMHAARHLHYDFRLECKGVLKSWAVPKGPSLDPSIKRLAVEVEDHPLEYKDFEGVIPKGEYGGGTVMIWDEGSWEEVDDGKSLENGNAVTFILHGNKLKGKWKLIRIKNGKNWLLIKAKDEEACSSEKYEIVEEEILSVVSGRTLNEIKHAADASWSSKKKKSQIRDKTKAKAYSLPKRIKDTLSIKKIPKYIKPQLATLVTRPPQGEEWVHEMKFDGYRLLAMINSEVKLMTRGLQNWTHKFERIKNEIEKLKLKESVLDGELVAIDEKGIPNFQLLQNAIKANDNRPFAYYVFDILHYQGYDLTTLELGERKKILAHILEGKSEIIRYSDHIQGQGEKVFKKAKKLGFEGIVSKNIHSTYLCKRTKNWQKIKVNFRQEFVIGGFTKPEGERGYLGALLLGTYNKEGELEYCGRVGTGFTDASLKALSEVLTANETKHCPFSQRPPAKDLLSWVKPSILAEIEFKEWTDDGILRHASFKGLRADKKTREVSKEDPMSTLILTHPDKLLYPIAKVTKQDIAIYYNEIQDWILPYVSNRPLSILRCPDGLNSECFYQKHLPNNKNSDFKAIAIKEKSKTENMPYLDSIEGLIQLVQINALEIHPWGSRVDNIEKPDYLTFDLDPGDGVTWKEVVRAAFQIKDEFDNLSLETFVKTTGGKGLHIVIPIQRRYDWETAGNFAQTFARYLALKYPEYYVDNMSKERRKGKIFIDYLRNRRGATAVAAYSLRARETASISTPLAWEELSLKIKSDHFTIKNILKRLNKISQDPWADFYMVKQKLPGADDFN